MRLKDSLFSPPEPRPTYHHDVLGDMNFSEDDEAWAALLNGITLFIAYTAQSEPDPVLIEYGISLVKERAWLESEIESAAHQFALRDAFYQNEVRGLKIGGIYVDRRKGINSALVDLTGGRDYRAWRLEFTERICMGMGFDS